MPPILYKTYKIFCSHYNKANMIRTMAIVPVNYVAPWATRFCFLRPAILPYTIWSIKSYICILRFPHFIYDNKLKIITYNLYFGKVFLFWTLQYFFLISKENLLTLQLAFRYHVYIYVTVEIIFVTSSFGFQHLHPIFV